MLDKTDIVQIVTAAIGGMISIMMRQEIKGAQNIFWGIMGCAFCGKSVAWLCKGMGINPDLTLFAVSVAGWVGANAVMKFFETQIKERLSTKKDTNHE